MSFVVGLAVLLERGRVVLTRQPDDDPKNALGASAIYLGKHVSMFAAFHAYN